MASNRLTWSREADGQRSQASNDEGQNRHRAQGGAEGPDGRGSTDGRWSDEKAQVGDRGDAGDGSCAASRAGPGAGQADDRWCTDRRTQARDADPGQSCPGVGRGRCAERAAASACAPLALIATSIAPDVAPSNNSATPDSATATTSRAPSCRASQVGLLGGAEGDAVPHSCRRFCGGGRRTGQPGGDSTDVA
jgi:hypothetical protein